MFRQTPERPNRSDHFFQMACYGPLVSEMGPFSSNLINPEILELARLTSEEERLAAQINNDDLLVDKSTVDKTVQLARKIASAGLTLEMVPLDEMLDIAQIFADVNTSDVIHIQFIRRANTKILQGQIYYPDSETATKLLAKVLADLKTTGNPAWSARVAAVLAYFSALKQ